MLGGTARAAVAKKLNGDQVRRRDQGEVGELGAVQGAGCHEGVYEDQGRFRGVVGGGHLVSGCYAAQVRYLDSPNRHSGVWWEGQECSDGRCCGRGGNSNVGNVGKLGCGLT